MRLNALTIDAASALPLYRQLADQIRDQIADGTLAPGADLPPEGEIAKTLALSMSTVREAIDLLVSEGRIIKRRGRASQIREEPPTVLIATSRYAEELARVQSGAKHPPLSAFSLDYAIDWDDYTVSTAYEYTRASEAAARLLQIPRGARVLRRELVDRAQGTAMRLRTSVFPLDLVEGTEITDPERQPWPGGTIAEIASLGKTVVKVVEDGRCRQPTSAEARVLELPSRVPVWEITRVFHDAAGPVEASELVLGADRHAIRWETVLSES